MGAFRTRGHPAALAAVARAIRTERPPHALLLVGPAGIGKTTLARDLAAGLLCRDPDPAERPCGACAGCRKVEHANHPDLHVLAPEGAGDQVRLAQVLRLATDLALLPMEGRWRVAIIEAAHRLNPDAQNALLKTLEEPVGAACIVLAAEDMDALLPTVLSRTARLRLGPVQPEAIRQLLADRGLADAARASAIARASGGRPGVAIALAADPEAMLTIQRLARSLLDLIFADRRARLAAVPELLADGAALDQVLRGAGPRPAATDDRRRPAPAERRRAVARVLAAWRDLGRDLAVAGRRAPAALHHVELLEDLRSAAVAVDGTELVRFLGRLDGLIAAIEAYANPELAMDALVLAWPRARRAA
jgi:DNA polymerase-3 subunit delta'